MCDLPAAGPPESSDAPFQLLQPSADTPDHVETSFGEGLECKSAAAQCCTRLGHEVVQQNLGPIHRCVNEATSRRKLWTAY